MIPARLAARLRVAVPRLPTAALRAHPDFLVVGVQRGGTSSLFAALARHPQVLAPPIKELHHFDHDRPWPDLVYRAYFPRRGALAVRARHHGVRAVTGEATPAYLFHPEAAARVATVLPDVRAVVLLREPVARAWSHYQMLLRNGDGHIGSFREAVEAGAATMRAPRRPHDHWVRPLGRFALFERGCYADQLTRWFGFFPREQVLVLRSEDWYEHQAETFAEVCRFLDLEVVVPRPVWQNRGEGTSMDPEDRAWLAERYRRPNEALADLVGITWPAAP